MGRNQAKTGRVQKNKREEPERDEGGFRLDFDFVFAFGIDIRGSPSIVDHLFDIDLQPPLRHRSSTGSSPSISDGIVVFDLLDLQPSWYLFYLFPFLFSLKNPAFSFILFFSLSFSSLLSLSCSFGFGLVGCVAVDCEQEVKEWSEQ